MLAWVLGVGVVVLSAGAARAEWVPPAGPDCPARPGDAEAARVQASELFGRAIELGEAGEWSASAGQFACSYGAMPHPNTLFNLGLAAEKAGDLATAESALAQCLLDAPDAEYGAQAREMLASVRERLAAAAPVPSPLPEGGELSTTAVVGWALLGSGVAVAAGIGISFSVLASDEKDAFELGPPGELTWPEAEPHQQQYRTYSALAVAGFLVGGAIAVGGVVLLILDATAEEPPAVPALALFADGAGLVLSGTF